MMKHQFIYLLIAFLVTACGDDNLLEADLTPEEEARLLMNEGKYSEAIEILEPLVEAEPEEYSRMPLLSAAYAGLAGIGLLKILDAQISGGGSDSLFEQLEGFLPTDYDRTDVATLDSAVQQLEAIPAANRGSEGDPEYGESAELQLFLYRSMYATMYLYLFVSLDINGNLDPDTLSNLTLEDATAILSALRDAASDGGSDEGGEALDETLAEIDATEGSTDEEKLSNYIAAQETN